MKIPSPILPSARRPERFPWAGPPPISALVVVLLAMGSCAGPLAFSTPQSQQDETEARVNARLVHYPNGVVTCPTAGDVECWCRLQFSSQGLCQHAKDEARREAQAQETKKAEAEAQAYAASHPEEMAKQEAEQKKEARREISINLCAAAIGEREKLDQIAELKRDARIAGVINSRDLYEAQTGVAVWRKIEKAFLGQLQNMGGKPISCRQLPPADVAAASRAMAGQQLCDVLNNVDGDPSHAPSICHADL